MLRAVASNTSGITQLKTLGANTASIGNSETIVMQAQLGVGQWQTNGIIRIWVTGTKSGSTDIGRMTVRIGTAGTTADTAVTGLSNFSFWGSTSLTAGGVYDIKLVSATSAQRLGNNGAVGSAYSGGSTAAAPAATTITDASANALYVSVSVSSAGATDTVIVQSGQIQLIAP